MELAYQKSGESTWYYAGASRFQNPIRVQVVAAPVSTDSYENNDNTNSAYLLPCNFSGNSVTVSTTGSNLHNSSDVDYYKIKLNPGQNYVITPRLYDSYNNGDNGVYYTVDAKFAYTTDGTNWSEFYDDVMPSSITTNGGTVFFCVMPYFEGKTGTYLLQINVTSGTGVDETGETFFSIYPNPAKDLVNIDCKRVDEIRLFNALGQRVETINTTGSDLVQISLEGMPCGVYVIQAVGSNYTLTRRIVKAE